MTKAPLLGDGALSFRYNLWLPTSERPNPKHTKKQAKSLAVGFQNQKEKRPQAWKAGALFQSNNWASATPGISNDTGFTDASGTSHRGTTLQYNTTHAPTGGDL